MFDIIAPICIVDVGVSEIWVYAVISALIALVPILGTLAIVAIHQYARIREAWEIANSNHTTLHETVLPQLNRIQSEGEESHAAVIQALNGGADTARHDIATGPAGPAGATGSGAA